MANVASTLTGRDRDETHRASSPLELLFDLCFVVAISQAAAQLHHAVTAGHLHDGILGFSMVFFAIWWAWMNFTWFASAYDTDDIVWRLLTFVQIAGVLVLASGVPATFATGDLVAITLGYVIMRVALLAQWVRAAIGHRQMRRTALRYVIGVTVVQIAWLGRLALDDRHQVATFFTLAACELLIPLWAERPAKIPWHPEHIAERYGLFTLIVLGECVLSATIAVQSAYGESGVSGGLVMIGITGLVAVFAAWWYAFDAAFAEGLRAQPGLRFPWGYLHVFVFASIAALGAGLAVVVDVADHHAHVEASTAAFAVALPLALFVLVIGVLQQLVVRRHIQGLGWSVAAALVTAMIPGFLGDVELPLLLALVALPLVLLVVRGQFTGLGAACAVD